MIVDCYTHTWESDDQLGRCFPPVRPGVQNSIVGASRRGAGIVRHLAASEPVGVAFVLGFRSRYLGADISNDFVASYVHSHPERLIGFAGIDPSEPKAAMAEARRAHDELAMRGIAVAPAAQDFHPSSSQAMLVYAAAGELGMPIMFHTGICMTAATKLEYARPLLLDEVARELPDLKIVVAHLGYPWVNETIVLLAKHENVFADISGVLENPWEAYQALSSAYQHGVMHKLLFGSGFPLASASTCIEALYSINHLCHGTNLPTVPREQLRGIVERDALSLLGIPRPQQQSGLQPVAALAEEDGGER